jgi:hypothetical protein
MTEKIKVLRFSDYDRKSREPDSLGPRDPCDSAVIIILPVVRIERAPRREKKSMARKSR